MIGLEDLILIFYIWVPSLAMEVIMKNNQFKQHIATIYRRLSKTTTAFVYRSTCLVHFTMLVPIESHKESDHKIHNRLKK